MRLPLQGAKGQRIKATQLAATGSSRSVPRRARYSQTLRRRLERPHDFLIEIAAQKHHDGKQDRRREDDKLGETVGADEVPLFPEHGVGAAFWPSEPARAFGLV